jgi:hypothetical protein
VESKRTTCARSSWAAKATTLVTIRQPAYRWREITPGTFPKRSGSCTWVARLNVGFDLLGRAREQVRPGAAAKRDRLLVVKRDLFLYGELGQATFVGGVRASCWCAQKTRPPLANLKPGARSGGPTDVGPTLCGTRASS